MSYEQRVLVGLKYIYCEIHKKQQYRDDYDLVNILKNIIQFYEKVTKTT